MGKMALDKRLSMLANLELGNAAGFPALAALFHFSGKYTLGILTLSALIPTCAFLLIGSYFWYAKRADMRGTVHNYREKLSNISRWENAKYLLLLTPAALGFVLFKNIEIGKVDAYMTMFFWCLGFAEWINYYHRQLMHFDNKADFKRFLTGKGFQIPWLKRELIAAGLR